MCSSPDGQIWDPYTSVYDPNQGGPERQNFIPFNNLTTYMSPGIAKIASLHPIPAAPGNAIDPVAFKIMQFFPMPNLDVASVSYDRLNNCIASGAVQNLHAQFGIT